MNRNGALRDCLLLLALLAFMAPPSFSQEHRWAVVQIPSHGGSGTVIESGNGRSLILSCAHMFETREDMTKPIRIDAPSPQAGTPKRVGVKLLAVDHRADLSLIEINAELPYVAPVAQRGGGRLCLSVGYDGMRRPPQMRSVTLLSSDGERTYTRERPNHGRSGGALLNDETGELIGVVQGYEAIPSGRGIYASHAAVVAFLGRHEQKQRGNGLGYPYKPTDPPDLYVPKGLPPSQRSFPGSQRADPQCPT